MLQSAAIVDHDFLIAIVVGCLEFALRFFSGVRRTRLKKKMLRTMLQSSKYQWRHIHTLSRRIGESEETTEQLLIDIGARPDEAGRRIWTLDPPK
jgi:predicted metal-dependent phosphoesterase TrpH